MLNRWVRYSRVQDVLGNENNGLVLEIGSGSIGLGEFFPLSYIGCDVIFDPAVMAGGLIPVQASGARLPFRDNSFPLTVCLDMLEHVPRAMRRTVVREAFRVTRSTLVLGAPMDPAAGNTDQRLARLYRKRRKSAPLWLDEHIALIDEFPTTEEMRSLLQGVNARFEERKGEGRWLHFWMSVLEDLPGSRSILARSSRLPWRTYLTPFLQMLNRSGTYRKYFIVRK